VSTVVGTSGEALKDHVCQLLEDVSLTLIFLSGRVMMVPETCEASKAVYRPQYNSSVQRQFVWCYAHRLSLVVVYVLGQSSTDIKVCIGTLEELHTFLGGYKRHVIFMDEIDKLRLPRLQIQRTDTIRQGSRSERAVNAYMRVLPAVLTLLTGAQLTTVWTVPR